MAANPTLPSANAPIMEGGGPSTPQFYRFFMAMAQAQLGNASAAQIAEIDEALAILQAQVDALPKNGGYPTLRVTPPITLSGLLQNGLALVGWGGTTTDVPEGVNLYFTDERAQDAIADVCNYCTNGAFDVWQNGTSFTHAGSSTGTGAYDADCTGTWAVNSSVSTERKSATGEGLPVGTRYFCRDTVTGVDDIGTILFRSFNIEGTRQFEGRTFTTPLYVRAHQACTVGVQFVQFYGLKDGVSLGAASGGYHAFTLAANEWTLIAPSFSVPLSTATIDPDANTAAGAQLRLYMNLASAWNFPDPQIGNASGVFDWALVTVRDGGDQPILTPLVETIAACERAFEKSFDLETAPAQNVGLMGAPVFPQSVAASTTSIVGSIRFRQRKPYAPTVTLFNPSAANANVCDVTVGSDWSSAAINYKDESGFYVSGTSASGSAAGDGAAFHWSADARGDAPAAGPTLYQRDTSDASVRVTSDGSIRVCNV